MGLLGRIPVEYRTLGLVVLSLALTITSLSTSWFVYKERNTDTQQWTSRYECVLRAASPGAPILTRPQSASPRPRVALSAAHALVFSTSGARTCASAAGRSRPSWSSRRTARRAI